MQDCEKKCPIVSKLCRENDELRRILQTVFTDLINGNGSMTEAAKKQVFDEMMASETAWFAGAARTMLGRG